jgi:esterase/lipase superfamily enzyme
VTKLEMENSNLLAENAKLLSELEQTHVTFAEADATRNSLSLTHGKLEEECTCLRAIARMLGRQKTEAEAARKAKCKRFQNYCIHHRKKLHELQMNLRV